MKSFNHSIFQHFWFYCLFGALASVQSAQATYRVLFIGNSYTIGQGPGPDDPGSYTPTETGRTIPDVFDALARAGGQEDPIIDAWLDGGRGFEDHYTNQLASDYIGEQAWTHVILQNYSTGPTHVGNIADHMTYGGLLYDAVIANNPETQVHLYMTWARAAVHSMISGSSTASTFATTDEMLDELRTNYYALANSLTANHPGNLPVIVNPVGDAWNNAGGNLPASDPDFIDLFTTDEYHGNNLGYYLSACVHYASIYKSSPVGLFETPIMQDLLGYHLDSAEAAFVEQVAWETVLATDIIEPSILIDFGASASQAASQATTGQYWNNVTESAGGSLNASISGLLEKSGSTSSIDLTILAPFNAAESSGTELSTLYPAEATVDALYGNSGLYNGQSDVAPSFKLSGLDPTMAYRLSFYASRTGGSDNYQTRYTCIGDRVVSVDSDPQDNVDTVAVADALYPDENNEITVSLTAGPANDNALGLIYLGALKLNQLSEVNLSLSSQPASQSVEENASASFSVTVDSDRLVTAQWYQDGTLIPGATSLTYTIDQAARDADGSTFSVIVDNGVFSVESSMAALTVLVDLTAPQVSGLLRSDAQTMVLTFDEAIDSETALIVGNYQVANRGRLLGPSAVELSSDGTSISLTFEESLEGNVVVQLSELITDLVGNAVDVTDRMQSYTSSTSSGTSGTILIDFGTSASVSDPDYTWNQLATSSSIQSTIDSSEQPYVYSSDLLNSNGALSGIGLSVSDALEASNNAGSTSDSGPYPQGVTQDNFYGSNNDTQGVYHFTNLNLGTTYNFTFFASRMWAGERKTHYVLQGANSEEADLEAAMNTNNTVTISDIQPDASGVITLTISKGPDNVDGYFYINAIELGIGVVAEPQVFAPVRLDRSWIIDWVGSGTLMSTDDLTQEWQAVDPQPTAPFQDEEASAGARFYQLVY